MRDLCDPGLKDVQLHFIDDFLSDRKFKDCVGSSLSHMKNLIEGAPHGSILSVTQFSIEINNITKNLSPAMDGSL